ncbi:MAG: ATP-binding cassette domain-containing protein [Acidimicrobiales bacterium]|nr:ATP-binding cassette domain-containing protein [Acidimicrobiales bacterium]
MARLRTDPRLGPVRMAGATLAVILALRLAFRPGAPPGVFLNGAIVGGLYGLIAMGLILIYKSDRIISFAQAGLGAFPAVLALNLYIQRDWPFALCLVLALAGSFAIGALAQRLIIRRFASSPRLILTVATIGLAQLLAFAEFMSPTWIGGEVTPTGAVRTPVSGITADIGGIVFRGDHLAAVVVVVLAALGLGWFLNGTRVGVAVRAVAENRDRAQLAGVPVARLGTIVWGVAGLLSGIGVFFRAPITGLPLGSLIGPQVLLFALAAAVIARMERLGVALLAGALLGMFDQAAFYSTRTASISTALLLPIVLAALLVQRRHLSRAADSGSATWQAVRPLRTLPPLVRRLPEVRVARGLGAGLFAALLLGAPFLVDELRRNDLSQVLLFGVIAVSLVVLTGWTGQISLGQFAFTGVGSAVAGGLAGKAGADFFVALLLGGLAGAALSMVVGIPALRVKGFFLALTTLAFAASTQAYVLNREHFSWLLPEIGDAIDRPKLWGVLDLRSDSSYYFTCLALLLLAVAGARNLRRSRAGRALVATRDNERAAQSYGINLARARLGAFAIAGFLAGSAGALYVYLYEAVDPESFGSSRSIDVFAMAVIGGLGSIGGGLAGAVYVVGIKEFLPRYELLASGGGLLLLLMFLPGGLAEVGVRLRDAFVKLVARRHGLDERALKWGVEDEGAVTVLDSHASTDPAPVVVGASSADDATLLCRGVDAGYDRVQVLYGIDLEVHRGEIVALLGTNGAGKSTLLRTICGLQPATAGSVRFRGEEIVGTSASDIARQGLVYMPGGRGVFPTLSVEENLQVATWLLSPEEAEGAVERALEQFPRLQERIGQMAGNLSGGEQQMLSLAMAFVMVPDLLVIDELSLGLAPVVVGQLVEFVKAMNRAGTTVLIVEQSVNLALTLADRAYFMEKGQVRFTGPTAELLERGDLLRAVMLRGGPDTPEPSPEPVPEAIPAASRRPIVATPASPAAPDVSPEGAGGSEPAHTGPLLSLTDVRKRFGGVTAVAGATFEVHPGEVLGIIGPNGAGKTTTFDLISGFLQPDAGQIQFLGEDITGRAPDVRARAGLGRLFQDSLLFPSMTVTENLAVAFERHIPIHDDLAALLGLPEVRRAEGDIAWSVHDLLELFDLGLVRDLLAGELSTGTRRVVDLAMAVAHAPAVLLLDEPSSGLAQRETEALTPMLRRIQRETGAAMVIIEHDMSLITEVSDRMLALEVGVVIAQGSPSEVVSHPRVVSSYLGGDDAAIGRSGPPRRSTARRAPEPGNGTAPGGRSGKAPAEPGPQRAATAKASATAAKAKPKAAATPNGSGADNAKASGAGIPRRAARSRDETLTAAGSRRTTTKG